MGTMVAGMRRYGGLALVLLTLGIGSALTVAGCGNDGGSSGELCGGCGESDGACRPTHTVAEGDRGADELCTNGTGPCTVGLLCRRKLDSAQRRCFPTTESDRTGPFAFFECDGARPNTEVRPTPTVTVTPTRTPVATPTGPTPTGPTPTPTGPTPTVTTTPDPGMEEFCGNDVVEGDEDCDGTDLDEQLCEDLCESANDLNDPFGTLDCNADCTFDFTGCENAIDCAP